LNRARPTGDDPAGGRAVEELDFYRTCAIAAFTLLGLWWVVAQFKYRTWATTAAGRRIVYDISLYFLLPGAMGLLALLSTDTGTIWRLGFGVAAAAGAAEAVAALLWARGHGGYPAYLGAGLGAAAVLYVLIALVAAFPGDVYDATGLRALQAEGVLVTGVLVLGVNVAFLVFAAPDREEPR
jgi:hypothetical protein